MNMTMLSRGPPWMKNAVYKVSYLAFTLAIVGVLYGSAASIMYAEDGSGKYAIDRTIEAWVWFALVFSWCTYFVLQGSDPGYINRAIRIGGAAPMDAATSSVTVHAVNETIGSSVPAEEVRGAERNSGATAVHRERETDGSDLLGREDSDFDPEVPGALSGAAAAAISGVRDCKWCHVSQPARGHHCRDCGQCVATFDHHCSWIGTCIGERNRGRFWWFLFAQTHALAWAIGVLNTGFVWRRGTGDWLSANAGSIFTLLVLWGLQLFVAGLWVFHSWLACTNTTTYETGSGAKKLWYLAGTEPKDCDLPYSTGLCTNLRLFCCVLDTGCGCRRRRRGEAWTPKVWAFPGKVERESEDWRSNIWENKYYSCC